MAGTTADNTLYYGDNLDILRHTTPVYFPDECVDLIYLDPPFNSNASYNVLFHERDGSRAAAQIQAFEDTWEWNIESERAFWDVVNRGGQPAQAMRAFRQLLNENDMLAYLAMMAPRLIELHRVLRPTGSIYLHCDPTASHYLKLLMDSIFGPVNFRADITWKRHSAHNDAKQTFAAVTDTILFYAKSPQAPFNVQWVPYDEKYIEGFFRYVDERGRRYSVNSLKSPHPRPNLTYEYKGYPPPDNGWTCTREKMEEYDRQGRLEFPKNPTGRLRLRYYLDDMPGALVTNLWDDVPALSGAHAERLGYPTQKPLTLLERIIQASSKPGDVVLDPFCGCGTAIVAAQKLGRRWIGIDITHLAVGLLKSRLRDSFGPDIANTYRVIGEPTTLQGAIKLAEEDKFQFQAWALGLVGARTATSARKGADRGIDGRLIFNEGGPTGDKEAILSVKGGHLRPDDIRALGQVVTREGAELGVLITLEEPTPGMSADAASAGFYTSPWGQHPRLQILTIRELLGGKKIDMPQTRGVNQTFKQAPKVKSPAGATTPTIWGMGVSEGHGGGTATIGAAISNDRADDADGFDDDEE